MHWVEILFRTVTRMDLYPSFTINNLKYTSALSRGNETEAI